MRRRTGGGSIARSRWSGSSSPGCPRFQAWTRSSRRRSDDRGASAEPTLRAVETADRWRLDGVSPFVSGWGLIDVVHTAARVDDEIVWLIVDAAESESLRVDRLALVALNATATVRVTYDGHAVPLDRVTGRHPSGGT